MTASSPVLTIAVSAPSGSARCRPTRSFDPPTPPASAATFIIGCREPPGWAVLGKAQSSSLLCMTRPDPAGRAAEGARLDDGEVRDLAELARHDPSTLMA